MIMGNNPSWYQGDMNRPVELVSWEDVQEFIRRLNQKESETKYRLPKEAEWEYAARAGRTTSYGFGNDVSQLGMYAWYDKNAGNATHPVGQKQSNPWSLYDMHGNVWEWVQDWYGSYTAASSVDPTGPASGTSRVRRGGSSFNDSRFVRAARRFSSAPSNRDAGIGFRLAREVP